MKDVGIRAFIACLDVMRSIARMVRLWERIADESILLLALKEYEILCASGLFDGYVKLKSTDSG